MMGMTAFRSLRACWFSPQHNKFSNRSVDLTDFQWGGVMDGAPAVDITGGGEPFMPE